MSWPPHITVAAIAERDGKYLFVEENIQGELVLNQPAGHLDPGETLFDAVRREVLEETGWRVEPKSLAGIYHFYSPKAQITYHRITFAVQPLEATDRALDPVIHKVHWLAPDALDGFKLRSPLVRLCLDDFRRRGGMPLEFIEHVGALPRGDAQ